MAPLLVVINGADKPFRTTFDEDVYAGVRVSFVVRLATEVLPVHVDVNVGVPVWPPPGPIDLAQARWAAWRRKYGSTTLYLHRFERSMRSAQHEDLRPATGSRLAVCRS